ncbi:hypothetical protein QQS21_004743 [Conoideocrella luteorostrata]|uniref:Zn(2)-C6 fungal-type domain-containing protein n=1 Tax=Conoideocrella luteorostrata TaxID=1105319 RepID=A0AAJ0CRQ2_9HYPO|nr:hypothetical protein QQS21_004743 [Conoideocrella luteorostrata]
MNSIHDNSDRHGVASSAPRRRNGRLQACEPCRKRKVACDHHLPVCSRCRRGKIASSCIYVDQKEHQPRLKFTPPASPASRKSTPREHVNLEPSSVLEDDFSPQPDNNVGYLGATSFSAVFKDTQYNLPLNGRTPEQVDEAASSMVDDTPGERAINILRAIPDHETCTSLFKLHVNPNDSWCRLAAQIMNESIWITFGDVLEDMRTTANLRQMANILCRNSSTPLQENYTDPIEWLRSFSGPNLRWESLGLLFCYWALGTISLPENAGLRDTEELRGSDGRRLLVKYMRAAGRCIDICKCGSTANSMLAILLYRYGVAQSLIAGDTSIQHWRIYGDLYALTTFLGLHATPPSMIDDHSISSEIKRRLYAMIFKSDKVGSLFTGRPPFLGSRFATTPLPLDISDDELLNSDAKSLGSSPNIDENGWNTKGQIYSVTVMRAKVMIDLVKEDILEIALQPTPRGGNTEALQHLKVREQETMEKLPSVLAYRDTDASDPETDGPTLYARLVVQLDHLQNMFTIERLLSKETGLSSPEMIEISYDLISLTLIFWTHQEKLGGATADSEWILMCYAAPAAGILCMELLRGRNATIPVTPSRNNKAGAEPITRSRLIQQLSLLVGFLDWVGPMAPNAESCRSVKKAVRHVLDQALNEGALQVENAGQMDWVGDWGMELSADMSEFFNFELLHTFDWLSAEGQ